MQINTRRIGWVNRSMAGRNPATHATQVGSVGYGGLAISRASQAGGWPFPAAWASMVTVYEIAATASSVTNGVHVSTGQ